MKHAGITRFGVLLLLSTWFANLIPPALAQESEPGASNEKAQTLKQDDAAKTMLSEVPRLERRGQFGTTTGTALHP